MASYGALGGRTRLRVLSAAASKVGKLEDVVVRYAEIM